MNCGTKIIQYKHEQMCELPKGHSERHNLRITVDSSEGITYAIVHWDSPKVPGMRAGRRVRLADGRLGKLSTPRGCCCGPNKEECWDISLDEGGGIQGFGGQFSLVENTQNT